MFSCSITAQGRNKKVPGNKWKWTHNNPKPMGHSKGGLQREIHNNTSIPKEDRKISNTQLHSTSIRTRGTTGKTPQSK